MNSTSKRFQSLDLIKNEKLHGGYNYQMPPSKRLGKPKDDKMFVYTYTGTDPINNIYKTRAVESSSNLLTQTESNINNRTYSQPRTSLINATKL
jgi:hypothetical protein